MTVPAEYMNMLRLFFALSAYIFCLLSSIDIRALVNGSEGASGIADSVDCRGEDVEA